MKHPAIIITADDKRVSGYVGQVMTNSLGEPYSLVLSVPSTTPGLTRDSRIIPIEPGVEIRFVDEVALARERHRSGE